jgi:hypothetical protein
VRAPPIALARFIERHASRPTRPDAGAHAHRQPNAGADAA